MTALTADRNTPHREGRFYVDPVAAATKIFAGSIVVLDAYGNAIPAAVATGLRARGRAEEQVDNTNGSAGDLKILVRAGEFAFKSDGNLDRTHIGGIVYLVDDQTVSPTSTSRSEAGILTDLEGEGASAVAWVSIGEADRMNLADTSVTTGKLANGAVTTAKLAADAVDGTKIADAAISLEHLDAALTPTHIVVAAGIHPWAGGAATTDSISVTGLLSTDIVLATLVARASTETLILAVNDDTHDQIDLTLSANGTDTTTKIAYCVLRAVA